MTTEEDLVNRFAFHPASTTEKQNDHASVRMHCFSTAQFILQNTPNCREQSLAITKMEEAMMWANAAIARNSDER